MKVTRFLSYQCPWSLAKFLVDSAIRGIWSPVQLLVISLCLLLGVFLGMNLGRQLERIAGVSGRLLAFPTALLGVLLLAWLLALWRVLIFLPFPPCRQGKCHGIDDYRGPLGAIFGRVGWRLYLYRCNCGDMYVRRKRRFMILLPDNKVQAYKKLVGFRTWVDVTSQIAIVLFPELGS